MAKNEKAGLIVSYALIVILTLGMWFIFSHRATYIQLGSVFGTIMAGNVLVRTWPRQRKIIAAVQGGPAADPTEVARAGVCSQHKTSLSVPCVFSIVGHHFSA